MQAFRRAVTAVAGEGRVGSHEVPRVGAQLVVRDAEYARDANLQPEDGFPIVTKAAERHLGFAVKWVLLYVAHYGLRHYAGDLRIALYTNETGFDCRIGAEKMVGSVHKKIRKKYTKSK